MPVVYDRQPVVWFTELYLWLLHLLGDKRCLQRRLSSHILIKLLIAPETNSEYKRPAMKFRWNICTARSANISHVLWRPNRVSQPHWSLFWLPESSNTMYDKNFRQVNLNRHQANHTMYVWGSTATKNKIEDRFLRIGLMACRYAQRDCTYPVIIMVVSNARSEHLKRNVKMRFSSNIANPPQSHFGRAASLPLTAENGLARCVC